MNLEFFTISFLLMERFFVMYDLGINRVLIKPGSCSQLVCECWVITVHFFNND